MSRNRALLLMIICLLVGAGLRLPALLVTPPGLHFDEATNAILSSEIGLQGSRPVFSPSYTGQEVLFFYLAGGMMNRLGASVFALRLTSAFVGLLTIAATYWLGRELLADRRVAVLAAVLLAISFWHLLFSRLGLRAISQPLLQALTVAALFRGVRRQQWVWFGVSGLFLGLTAYTYLAARLFPLPVGLALGPLLLAGRNHKRLWGQLSLWVGVGLVVLGPLLLYFYQHPETFWVRIEQVGPAGANLTLWQGYLKALGIFFLVGDPYWRFNLPGRALFPWLWGGLFVVGWGLLLLRRRPEWYAWQKGSVILLVVIPFTMILPTALALNEILPSNLRAIGLIPFVFYLPAVGLVSLLEHLANSLRQSRPVTHWLQSWHLLEGYEVNYAFAALLLLLIGGFATGQDYFQEWGQRSDLFYESDGDLAAVADFLNAEARPDEVIYVSALHYRHPTLAFLSQDYDRLKWVLSSAALVVPAGNGPALYIYPHNTPLPAWAASYFAATQPIFGPNGPDGQPTFTAYRLPNPAAPLVPTFAAQAHFGTIATLTGYDLAPATAGQPLALTLYWQIEAPAGASLQPFVHLEDNWHYRWSQTEPLAYPAGQWQVGEQIIQRVEIPVPAGTPPATYRLRLGLFAGDSGVRLPHLDSSGRYAGDSFVVEGVTITAGAELTDAAPQGVALVARPGLTLLGYEQPLESLANGETLPLALWWQATQPQPPLTVRLELIRPDNTGLILLDSQPVHGTYPFQSWQTPQWVIDRIDPTIPPQLAAGSYRLNLRLLDGQGHSIFAYGLGNLQVTATERLFARPESDFPFAATLGQEIALVGYNWREQEDGLIEVSLIWQAMVAPAGDYTVFFHVLNQDGSCCLWQQDNKPQQGQYPTMRWLPGEFVVDSYSMQLPADLPAGAYPVELGLYLAETGQRLVVEIPGREANDALYLRPIQIK